MGLLLEAHPEVDMFADLADLISPLLKQVKATSSTEPLVKPSIVCIFDFMNSFQN